jgi:selenide,water dikinase
MSTRRQLVLLGGGHSHLPAIAHAASWSASTAVTLVSPDAKTAYSGMVPGVIAGHYRAEDCLIDVERLAQRSGVRFVRARAVAVDPRQRTVRLDDGTTMGYDRLSIDVGATPGVSDELAAALDAGRCGDLALAPCKPFPLLIERLDRFVADLPGIHAPVDVCVAGAGLAGIEIALALAWRLRHRPDTRVQLLSSEDRLLPGQTHAIGAALERACRDAGVEIVPGTRIVAVELPGTLVAGDGRRFHAQLALFATGAAAPAWLARSGLALDVAGFVSVDATLASTSHPDVFAAGDCASVQPHPRPKAGVHAVRQGAPLAMNLRRALAGEAALPFTPQKQALALVALGPRRAIAIRNGLAAGGPASRGWLGRAPSDAIARVLWLCKDRIDRAFVLQFRGGSS